MLGKVIQLGDSFRDKSVETLTGMKRHIMFVIAESDDDVLVVPMDSIPTGIKSTVKTKNSQIITIRYPQAVEFPLTINAYGYKEITVPSFINYKKAQLYTKLNLQFLLRDYEIEILEPISDLFLKELREIGMKSKFLKNSLKIFLSNH